jgi:hypothetical protein
MYRTRSDITTSNQITVEEELVPSCPERIEIDEESEFTFLFLFSRTQGILKKQS